MPLSRELDFSRKNPRNFPSRAFGKILFPVLSQSRHSGLAKYACAHLYTTKADSKKRLFHTIFTDYCKTALVVMVKKTVHLNFAHKILLLKFCCSIFTVFCSNVQTRTELVGSQRWEKGYPTQTDAWGLGANPFIQLACPRHELTAVIIVVIGVVFS